MCSVECTLKNGIDFAYKCLDKTKNSINTEHKKIKQPI